MKQSDTPSDPSRFPMVEEDGRPCPGQLEIPTLREQKALAAMRAIKEQVKPLKERLSSLEKTDQGSGREAVTVREELARLKGEWDAWETERRAAAKERMILLGHEDPE